MCFFVRLSCWFADVIQVCNVVPTTSHVSVCVNKAVSQVTGQKLSRISHTNAEKTENNNGVQCVSIHSCCWSYGLKMAPLCLLHTGRMRFLSVGVLGCQLSVRSSDSTSFLLEFTYLFIRTIQWAEPSRLLQLHFSCGEVSSCSVGGLASVKSLCSSWMDYVYDLGLHLDPFFFFFGIL